MLSDLGGQWPPPGEVADVEEWRAALLIGQGHAEAAEPTPDTPDTES